MILEYESDYEEETEEGFAPVIPVIIQYTYTPPETGSFDSPHLQGEVEIIGVEDQFGNLIDCDDAWLERYRKQCYESITRKQWN